MNEGKQYVMRDRDVVEVRFDLGDRAANFRILVRDRAGQFTEAFDAVLAGAGVEAGCQ